MAKAWLRAHLSESEKTGWDQCGEVSSFHNLLPNFQGESSLCVNVLGVLSIVAVGHFDMENAILMIGEAYAYG